MSEKDMFKESDQMFLPGFEKIAAEVDESIKNGQEEITSLSDEDVVKMEDAKKQIESLENRVEYLKQKEVDFIRRINELVYSDNI